jgi:hypothetical protein
VLVCLEFYGLDASGLKRIVDLLRGRPNDIGARAGARSKLAKALSPGGAHLGKVEGILRHGVERWFLVS